MSDARRTIAVKAAPDEFTPVNPWAMAALTFGSTGFLVITAMAAVVLGVVGLLRAKTTGVGGRAAAIGLGLGVLWLTGLGLAGVWVWRDGATFVAHRHRAELVTVINGLPAPTAAPTPGPGATEFYRISPSRVHELGTIVRPLGVCRDVTIGTAHFSNRDGVFGIDLSAQAVFDHANLPLRSRLVFDAQGFTLTELDFD